MNIEAKNLSKIYGDGENRVVALDHANLEIVSSDFISIMGPSITVFSVLWGSNHIEPLPRVPEILRT